MGRIINPESAGKERNRLARLVVTAIRRLMKQSEVDIHTKDLVAFVVLALREIDQTIDPTVEAWEKRGYWIKADRYRMEWRWTESLGKKLEQAVFSDDWGLVAATTAEIAAKLANVSELKRISPEEPWDGAWRQLTEPAKTIS
jgi:hypothetical protein